MKKKIFNLLKLFVLVLALFISFIGMKLNVFAAQSEFVGEPSFIPAHVAGTPSNNESVLVSLKGATVTVPSDWTAPLNNKGYYNVIGTISYGSVTNAEVTSFGIGFNVSFDGAEENCISYSNPRSPYTVDKFVSFTISFSSGSSLTDTNLIQWFVDNNATIIGGVYSDDVVSVTNDIGETKLVWELNWLETTEEIPCNYVEIYPSSDTKQCYIVFKKSFSIPMQLIVKSEDDESVYASCDVDCYERTETVGSASLSVSLDGSTNSDLLLGQDVEENEITFNGNTSYESIFTDQKIEINSMTATAVKVGTLATTQEVSYNIGLSEELQTLLEDREITFISTTSNLFTSTIKGLLERLITFTNDNKEIIYEALNTCDNWFRVDVEVVDKYHDEIINEYLYTINIIGFVINDYFNNSTIPTDLTNYKVTIPSGWTVNSAEIILNINGYFYNSVSSSFKNFTTFNLGYDFDDIDGIPFASSNSVFFENGAIMSYSNDSNLEFILLSGDDLNDSLFKNWLEDNNATFEYFNYFSVVFNNSSTYVFPLGGGSSYPFVNLDGLYDLTHSQYIKAPAVESYVALMPSNQTIYGNKNGSSPVYGDSFVFSGSILYTAFNSGGA